MFVCVRSVHEIQLGENKLWIVLIKAVQQDVRRLAVIFDALSYILAGLQSISKVRLEVVRKQGIDLLERFLIADLASFGLEGQVDKFK